MTHSQADGRKPHGVRSGIAAGGRVAQQAAEYRQAETGSQPQTTLEWWRQLEAELAAVDRAIEYEHRGAVTAGRPWPPTRTPEPEPERMPELDSSRRSDPQADVQSGRPDAGWEARAEYAARLRREAFAEPQHTAQPQTSYEAEIEL